MVYLSVSINKVLFLYKIANFALTNNNKKMAQLKLSSNKMIAGVAAGYAEFFGIDTNLVRILFVVAAIMGSLGLWFYLISWLVLSLSNK